MLAVEEEQPSAAQMGDASSEQPTRQSRKQTWMLCVRPHLTLNWMQMHMAENKLRLSLMRRMLQGQCHVPSLTRHQR
jgi:hypothetical protein